MSDNINGGIRKELSVRKQLSNKEFLALLRQNGLVVGNEGNLENRDLNRANADKRAAAAARDAAARDAAARDAAARDAAARDAAARDAAARGMLLRGMLLL
jgi:hypothetical protein